MLSLIQQSNSFEMQIEVFWTSSTDAQGVHTGITKAEKIVEDNRMQGISEFQQT